MRTLTTMPTASLTRKCSAAVCELVLQGALDAQVDGERHRAAVGLAADLAVEGAFGAGEARAVLAGEADEVGAGGAERIGARRLVLEVDARQGEIVHARLCLGREAAEDDSIRR